MPGIALLDTSVLLRFFHNHRDPVQRNADLLRDAFDRSEIELVLLDLSIYEFVNVLVRRMRRPEHEVERAATALFGLRTPIIRVDHVLALATAAVAERTGLSGYDASFVAAATTLGVALITADQAIVRRAAGLRVIPLDRLTP